MPPSLRRDVAVVEIQIADHDAVGEHSKVVTCLVAAAKDRRCGCRAHVAGEVAGDPARLGLVSADRAADCIENGTLHRAYYIAREIFVAKPDGEIRERLCDQSALRWRFISHCRGPCFFL